MAYDPILIALSQYGIKEEVGGENKEILKYFHYLGFSWVKEDETAWCAAFVNWVNKMAGLPISGKLNARSFLDIGTETTKPKIGDLVVLWRESKDSWKGHVGYYIRASNDKVWILGGNQDNEVNIKSFPKSRVLQYRKL